MEWAGVAVVTEEVEVVTEVRNMTRTGTWGLDCPRWDNDVDDNANILIFFLFL